MIRQKNIIMSVTGISCSNCALRIEAGVRKLKGVTDAATLEKVLVDGIISEGRSAFEESMIAGESMPVIRVPGKESK